jgi:hypothetical protein
MVNHLQFLGFCFGHRTSFDPLTKRRRSPETAQKNHVAADAAARKQQFSVVRRPAEIEDQSRSEFRQLFGLSSQDKEAINKSIEYFKDAVGLDPLYASAYAGLADAYSRRIQRYRMLAQAGKSITEAGPKAKAAALKAVELGRQQCRGVLGARISSCAMTDDQSGAPKWGTCGLILEPNEDCPVEFSLADR